MGLIGTNGKRLASQVPPFTAEDVTNVAQIASFVAKVCTDAGHSMDGLNVAGILGDLAKRIAQHLPLGEQLRLTPPPLDLHQEPNGDQTRPS